MGQKAESLIHGRNGHFIFSRHIFKMCDKVVTMAISGLQQGRPEDNIEKDGFRSSV
jgi:hypothetical protein